VLAGCVAVRNTNMHVRCLLELDVRRELFASLDGSHCDVFEFGGVVD